MSDRNTEDIIGALYDMVQDARSMPLAADKCILERDRVLDMLDEIRKNYDLSILMTTHDFSMLPRYANQAVLIDRGILIQGPPETVLNSPEFYQAFHMKGGSL